MLSHELSHERDFLTLTAPSRTLKMIFKRAQSVCLLTVALSAARRVEVRPRVEASQVYYEDDTHVRTATNVDDSDETSVYQPRVRLPVSPRAKDILNPLKVPPIQTIRNYNKVNDDGSFTFGYEAADGSFKEETRGTDCVVRGKYGYIDPDGNKREFTYVSGNPCDPNAPNEDDDGLVQKQTDEEDTLSPANYPKSRPIQRPVQGKYQKSTTVRTSPITIFQNEHAFQDEESSHQLKEDDEHNVLIRPTANRASQPHRNYLQTAPVRDDSLYSVTSSPIKSPSISPTFTRPISTSHKATSVNRLTTPAPLYPTLSSTRHRSILTRQRPETSTTSQPQSAIAITPRPVVQVTSQYTLPSSTGRAGAIYAKGGSTTVNNDKSTPPLNNDIHLNFAIELERYVNTVPAVTNRPIFPSKHNGLKAESIYQSELVFDPSDTQYKTHSYPSMSQELSDFRINQKLRSFVTQSVPQTFFGLQHQATQTSQPSTPQTKPQEAIYRQQQAQQLAQSQQLFAQQQRHQQQPQQYSTNSNYQLLTSQKEPKSYYYAVAPSSSLRPVASSLSLGQIDQFLRGRSLKFQ
ncbi:hypothetical protein PV328_004086 [Microctonus aethiopoides]|uniref:Uncharacterized protein n=1 Tax=Microctonus aethiopoides TaxID=144406 RepID=A0AA39KLB4_9HYME|nr:hypothetical protein PV328_004086 [Microctonus aethiopoides]